MAVVCNAAYDCEILVPARNEQNGENAIIRADVRNAKQNIEHETYERHENRERKRYGKGFVFS